jgi:hypothetical protein
MQAIHTKFLPATNRTGSRIKAYTTSGFTATVPYDHSLSYEMVHFEAVKALVKKHDLDWDISSMCYGDSADGHGYVFVFANSIVGS